MISVLSETEKSFYCVLFPRENQKPAAASFWSDCWTSCSEENCDEKSLIEFDIPAPQSGDGRSVWPVLLSLPEETWPRGSPVPEVQVIWKVRELRWSICKAWPGGAGEISYSAVSY